MKRAIKNYWLGTKRDSKTDMSKNVPSWSKYDAQNEGYKALSQNHLV